MVGGGQTLTSIPLQAKLRPRLQVQMFQRGVQNCGALRLGLASGISMAAVWLETHGKARLVKNLSA